MKALFTLAIFLLGGSSQAQHYLLDFEDVSPRPEESFLTADWESQGGNTYWVVANPDGPGNVLKVTIDYSNNMNPKSNHRTDFNPAKKPSWAESRHMERGVTYSHSMKIYIPEGMHDEHHLTWFQNHDYPDSAEDWRSPTEEVLTHNGNFEFCHRTSNLGINTNRDVKHDFHILGEATVDQWHEIWLVFRHDPTPEGKGFIKVYLNNELAYEYEGPTGYNDDLGHYSPRGMYDWMAKNKKPAMDKRTYYFDDWRILQGVEWQPGMELE